MIPTLSPSRGVINAVIRTDGALQQAVDLPGLPGAMDGYGKRPSDRGETSTTAPFPTAAHNPLENAR